MAESNTLPVQLVAGLIVNPAEGFERALSALEAAWGKVDMQSPVWPFDFTDYYRNEMGEGLLRQFVAFDNLQPLERLHQVKVESIEMEAHLGAASPAGVARPVNIDPGYICHSKLVLFSTKDFSHRIWVGGGIFAEVTLEWHKGGFVPLAYTFPDYRSEKYRTFFNEARNRYVRKLHARRSKQRH
ncbi:MAG: DUF4416 family protein [Planctomycetes bacterium]|nr:DUF4416 family protein [Planctomycetota bacterium]